jgi:predicted transcriptional regulator
VVPRFDKEGNMATLKMTRNDILTAYRNRIASLKAAGSPHKEIQPLSIPEVLLIKAVLHPTNKADSKELTRKLIMHLCKSGITTAAEIYEALGCADKPILRRLRKFKEMGLVRRESKRYYMPTARMDELVEKFLDRVCG